ncbi:MAG: hypothetical protein MUF06_20440, partial [Pirellulaceae bacterium]|nr:hypothetical protein [Pirellulaceae bacterium]
LVTLDATMVSALGDNAASTSAPNIRSNEGQSPRLDVTNGSSQTFAKGRFSFCGKALRLQWPLSENVQWVTGE